MTIKDELNKVLGGRMSRNSLFALVQSIVVTLCMFLSFRITLQEVGEELIGVWFLLLAGTAFVRVGDLSGVGALSRFVAMRTYRDQGDWAIRAINTVLITAVGMNLLIAFFVWVFAPVFIPRVFEPGFQQYAFALLPFAVSNMFLGAMAIAVTSGIDGTQRADQRAILMITVSIFMLVACFLLVPMYGIFGFVL